MPKLVNKLILTITSMCLVVLALGPSLALADNFSNSQQKDYIAQLRSSDITILSSQNYITKVKPRFQFTANFKFANTFSFQSTLGLQQLRESLANKFVYLDEDHEVKVGQVAFRQSPNDPAFTTNSTNIDKQWGLVKANFLEAWKKTTGTKNEIIAVIDTGLDGSHEDLQGTRIVAGYNVLTESSISGHDDFDDNGHGTLITGVIAAVGNNNIGMVGAAPSVSIMPVKALDASGSGTSSQISEAIVWATDHGADIINLSLGGIGFGHDKVLADAVSYAFDNNAIVVAAAGNDVAVTGGNLDTTPVFPICDDNGKNMIIGVTATDFNDLKPSFANFGKACIDVSAPGKRILSTINHDPATGGSVPNAYAYASGTSLAVPYVSAQAALLRAIFPDATNKQIRDRIIGTADNIDNLNLSQCAGLTCNGLLGAGRINVAASLRDQFSSVLDGDLVKISGRDTLYYINGGKRQMVSQFVKNQRFANVVPKSITFSDLDAFADGSYAEPLDSTLVKSSTDQTVYYIESGLRRPLTYQVFTMRDFRFSDVVTLGDAEVGSWITGSLFAPPDNSLVRSKNNPTVYWVVNGSLRAVNYQFFVNKGLNLLPVTYASDGDIAKFPKGEHFIQ